MRSAKRFWTCLAAVSVVTALVSGCNGDKLKTYPVTGSVEIEGAGDLKVGQVVFSNDTITAKGSITNEGTFKLGTYADGDGVPAGTYKVTVLGGSISKATPADPYKLEVLVDPKFTDPKTSGLEFTVEEGPNEFIIPVTAPGKTSTKAPAVPVRTRT